MVPNNGIHGINSCKSKLGLGGSPTSLIIFFYIVSRDMIVWYLILIPLYDKYEIVLHLLLS